MLFGTEDAATNAKWLSDTSFLNSNFMNHVWHAILLPAEDKQETLQDFAEQRNIFSIYKPFFIVAGMLCSVLPERRDRNVNFPTTPTGSILLIDIGIICERAYY